MDARTNRDPINPAGRLKRFLEVMGQWETSMPLTSQFVVTIDKVPQVVSEQIDQFFKNEHSRQYYTKDNDVITFLVRSVQLPFEQTTQQLYGEIDGIKQAMPFIVNDGRSWEVLSNGIVISFFETNLSFADFIIRPWITQISKRGLIADEKTQDLKTIITVYEFQKVAPNTSQIKRKVWKFENACPIRCNASKLDMKQQGEWPETEVQWIFSNYSLIETTEYGSVIDVINDVEGQNRVALNSNEVQLVSKSKDPIVYNTTLPEYAQPATKAIEKDTWKVGEGTDPLNFRFLYETAGLPGPAPKAYEITPLNTKKK